MSLQHAIELCGPLSHIRYVVGVCRRMMRSSVPGSYDWTEWQKTRRSYVANYLIFRLCRKGVRP